MPLTHTVINISVTRSLKCSTNNQIRLYQSIEIMITVVYTANRYLAAIKTKATFKATKISDKRYQPPRWVIFELIVLNILFDYSTKVINQGTILNESF